MSSNLTQRRLLEAAPDAYVGGYTSRDWNSITFSGCRHQVTLMFPSALRAAAFIDMVAEDKVDLPIAGQLVADIAVVEYDADVHAVVVEVLTLDQA